MDNQVLRAIKTKNDKKNDKTAVHKDSDDSNLIKRQSANSSTVKKEVFIIEGFDDQVCKWSRSFS